MIRLGVVVVVSPFMLMIMIAIPLRSTPVSGFTASPGSDFWRLDETFLCDKTSRTRDGFAHSRDGRAPRSVLK